MRLEKKPLQGKSAYIHCEEVDRLSNVLKLAIDIGHNCSYDLGASGIKSEDKLNLEVGTKLIEKCLSAGIEVIKCLPSSASSLYDSLNKRVAVANNHNADFFISIHHNAFPGAQGCEILCYPGSKGIDIAKVILPEIVSLGFRDRGVKIRDDLFVLKNTSMPAILIECAFCDSEHDMQIYNSEAMAAAIFRGIKKAFNIHNEESGQSKEEGLYHVVKKGDNLWTLSKMYFTTVKDIVALNNIKNPDLIYPGQKIRVK